MQPRQHTTHIRTRFGWIGYSVRWKRERSALCPLKELPKIRRDQLYCTATSTASSSAHRTAGPQRRTVVFTGCASWSAGLTLSTAADLRSRVLRPSRAHDPSSCGLIIERQRTHATQSLSCFQMRVQGVAPQPPRAGKETRTRHDASRTELCSQKKPKAVVFGHKGTQYDMGPERYSPWWPNTRAISRCGPGRRLCRRPWLPCQIRDESMNRSRPQWDACDSLVVLPLLLLQDGRPVL